MRAGGRTLLAAAAAVLLCAKGAGLLPQGRAVEELKLVTALAVQEGEQVAVTAVTGVRVTEEEEPEVLTGTGDSLAEACRDLRERSSRRAYLGQTQQLLLGEDGDLMSALEFVREDRDLRLDTLLYIIKGDAGEGLAASASQSAGETGGKDPRGRTIGQTLARLAERECTLVPALAPGQDGVLAPAGWAAIFPNGVAGFLDGEAAIGAELLAGQAGERVVTLPGGAVELTAARTWARGDAVCCTLEGRAVQGDPREDELAAWGHRVVKAALDPGWDGWGLRRELACVRFWDWETLKETDIAQLEVKVEGKLVENGG